MKLLLFIAAGVFLYGCSLLAEELNVSNEADVDVYVSLNSGTEIKVKSGKSENIGIPIATAVYMMVSEAKLICTFEILSPEVRKYSVVKVKDNKSPFILRIENSELNPTRCVNNGF